MRIRLLIDVETEDIERLQGYVADQPAVTLAFADDSPLMLGRFVGAKDAHDAVAEVATAPDPKA